MSDGRRSDADDLGRRIAAAKDARPHAAGGHGKAENRGMAAGIEFIGSVLVATFAGVMIDRWLHSAPWATIILLVLGFAAGIRRAITASAPPGPGRKG